ncbi:cAMP-dependent protein kinase catalytic subunit 3-like [Sabethes cyaneus]|uniref:cAMP-dependent protein kinase catalytic subunit 3-like n=1 Tax=Sabethes cyaneus TaxID=53552 RepID=UPI00237E2808|nr:cAMP-dependent protein kinase catalytic subunit 3-like [Sabethes cyaneus]
MWDAAAKVGDVSFSSKILMGPDLLTPLPMVQTFLEFTSWTSLPSGRPVPRHRCSSSNACETAYAAVVFFRLETDRGIEVTLFGAKTKVAPLKTLSILRRESKAAVSGHPLDRDRPEVSHVHGQSALLLERCKHCTRVGTGTFGRVCLCRDRLTDKYWAMKILAMADVIRLKQIEHVKNEKNILQEIDHPFIVNMRWHTKDDCCLYMLFEYVSGGELFSYLRNAGRFDNATANFYACEIVLALEYLHTLSVVYRDLKPENLLLDRDGHLKITDFGFAKKLKDRTWTLCGTPEYLAPEIIQSKGHNKAVDWWALGVLIYEMLVGYPPFYDDNPFGIYEKILSGKIEWSRHIEPIAKDLIKKLLVLDRTKRLGNMKNGAEDVKRHRWFKHLDWDVVIKRQLKPPLVPKFVNEGDTSNFDDYPETDWKSARSLDKMEMQLFEDF